MGPLSLVKKMVSVFWVSSPDFKDSKNFCWSSIEEKKLGKCDAGKFFSGESQHVFQMGVGEVNSQGILVKKNDT